VLVNTQCSVGFALNHRSDFTANQGSIFGIQWGATNIWFGTGSACLYDYGSGASAWNILNSSVTGIGWHWWNIVTVYSGSTGFTRVYRDGTLLAEQQPDTTWGGGAATDFTILLGNANGSAQVDIADLIVRNDTTLIPDSRVDTIFPDGTSAAAWVGSDGDSVNNHLLINENTTYNSATYVGSGTVNATDTYTMSNLLSSALSVSAVQVATRVFKTDAGIRTVAPMINGVAGTATDPGGGATLYNLTTTNPSGGAAWDTASVNAMTAGIKVVS